LGQTWKVTENCYKLHSCCGHTHTAIDVALDVRERRRWSAEDVLREVARIDVETYGPGYEIVRDPDPGTPYRAKFSLAYCVAAALLEGAVGLEQFTAERFDGNGVVDPCIATLLPRIRISVRDDLTSQYPAQWPTRVAIVSGDGSCERGASDYPRGNPENPVSTQTLADKFMALVSPRYGDAFATRALSFIRSIDDCVDVRAAFATLG
jgi:2-methylcitrate dehydratase PrpD